MHQAADVCEQKLIAYEFVTQVGPPQYIWWKLYMCIIHTLGLLQNIHTCPVLCLIALAPAPSLFDPPPPACACRVQAFLLYEDELTDSKAQIRALSCMVGALLRTRNFDEGDYDALCTKVRRSG